MCGSFRDMKPPHTHCSDFMDCCVGSDLVLSKPVLPAGCKILTESGRLWERRRGLDKPERKFPWDCEVEWKMRVRATLFLELPFLDPPLPQLWLVFGILQSLKVRGVAAQSWKWPLLCKEQNTGDGEVSLCQRG